MAVKNNIVWIDFENSPHVWVFKEIIKKLEESGLETIITARNFGQTIELCKYLNISFEAINVKKGNSSAGKLISVTKRAFALKKYFKINNIVPKLAVSHGSRSQALAAGLMNIPSITLDDYEYSYSGFNRFVNNILTPFAIDKSQWGKFENKVINYPGLKEELYLCNKSNYNDGNFDFIDNNKINILFRPESPTSHYKSQESAVLQEKIIEKLADSKNNNIILVLRDDSQKEYFDKLFNKYSINYKIPGKILNGPAMIWNCDLMIGGGGTMTREACVLNVPSYSFFGGKTGGADNYLIKEGRLKMIKNEEDLGNIRLAKKDKTEINISTKALEFVSDFMINFLYA